MQTRILAFAGSKQAGKSTCSNFLHGYQLRAHQVVENFGITEQGKLFVNTNVLDENGRETKTDTFLDTSRLDEDFVEWAMYNMWPFVKKYSFADSLKQLCITLFGIKYEQVYGSEAYKTQQVSHLRWENMPTRSKKKKGAMTVRDFMQYFGTDICRKMYAPVWVNRCINDIEIEQPLIAIIDDCRFENEIRAIQEVGGKVIGLTRKPFEDSHSSERVIEDNIDILDAVIDNQDMSIDEACRSVLSQIDEWGWLGTPVEDTKPKTLHKIKA